MTTTHEALINNHSVTLTTLPAGLTEVRFAMNGMGADIICRYWPVPDAATLGRDPWVFELEQIEGKGGRFSHVSAKGCQIAIARHLIEAGLIGASEDNSHLDARNQVTAADLIKAFVAHTGEPRIGDFVIMLDGSYQRCANAAQFGMQTCHGGSFHLSGSGRASMSGSLNRDQLWEHFQPTEKIKLGRFWFFSHNVAGAGRGVDIFVPCRVFRLQPVALSEERARAHPSAVRMAEVFGAGSLDHCRAIAQLMGERF